ncbi:methionine ABC transporter ATP-binding protein [Yersinia kristensenii]|uniref:methionine ABC transporter ATP-binding protein n=1 Tax=Yersinia kristensenii TaxID=28152 RepID=UPI0003038E1D|nr:methionine ABC transporter ATP-binding protein [Yersinia kristensenii]MBW5810507.1 methionine ABC transporter ATP-binding protein [Yersinia kristensenii]MBW5823578.1 methionine ABC transporter ATP-binding protein [Yersinia kristensenii]MBW5828062.1 methionine ABC transporter ATP-binding protein [Yersinia kristensenii]MDA5487673.1 methionine ABC transporter ATP-binding protein [Yersinia kristensenii]OWF85262.1 methionine ABC transporter ATP-binding protein [Yersinia kristensenii]
MISIERLSKTYAQGGLPMVALEEVSLEIPTGSVFGIIGRSGAGKSTLIRCLNLLERPTSGRIQVDGRELTTLSDRELRLQRQNIGMIFQNFHLLHSRNVWDNIAVGLEIKGIPKAQRQKRVAELLDLVGLTDKAQAFPSQLSGGQKQRVGIARALAAKPAYLLSDEATSALDPETTASILALLRDINRQLGLTIVLITHELDVVKSICDTAALLERGRVVETGAIADLLSSPHSRLGRALLPARGPASLSGTPVAELTFFDTLAASPVLSELAQQHAVGVTLLGGGVESIAGQRVGRLQVDFSHPDGGLNLTEVLQFLNERGVRAELI